MIVKPPLLTSMWHMCKPVPDQRPCELVGIRIRGEGVSDDLHVFPPRPVRHLQHCRVCTAYDVVESSKLAGLIEGMTEDADKALVLLLRLPSHQPRS